MQIAKTVLVFHDQQILEIRRCKRKLDALRGHLAQGAAQARAGEFVDQFTMDALIADLNSDATIDASDVTAWHRLAANTELRASGLACAGSVPCPDPAVVMLRDGSTVTIPGVAPGQRQCAPAH